MFITDQLPTNWHLVQHIVAVVCRFRVSEREMEIQIHQIGKWSFWVFSGKNLSPDIYSQSNLNLGVR